MTRTAVVLSVVSLAMWAAGSGPYRSAGFVDIPPQVKLGAVSGVEVDYKGRVYVLHRGEPPLLQFDKKGKYIKGWGEGTFKVAHGLRVDRDDNIWTTDNALHVIRKFSPNGELLLTLGEEGKSGNDEKHFRSPDDLAFNTAGEIYVADAGNARIVHLKKDGSFLGQWGTKGTGQSQFAAAHGLAISRDGRVYVADRGNNRIQVFAPDGKFVAEWKGFGNPFGALVVGEELLVSDGDANTISHLSLKNGAMVKQWGDSEILKLPHLMALAADKTLYVAEVNGKRIQRFVPVH
jgi:DNA-binding beta-propeller fold protein YncE